MKITTATVPNTTEIKLITSTATYGIGLITYICWCFAHLFGSECNEYSNKIAKAQELAEIRLVNKAKSLNADGIMNVSFQLHEHSVLAYGTAFKYNEAEEIPEI